MIVSIMERIDLVKSVRISQKLVGSLAIFFAVLNIGMGIYAQTFKAMIDAGEFLYFIFVLIEYPAAGIGGVLLLRRINWSLYMVSAVFFIDLALMILFGFLFFIVFDVIMIILCLQYMNNYKKYQEENMDISDVFDRKNESLTKN